MNKSLLALALMIGFAGVAQAECSVTLYGLVDAGYGYNRTETKFSGAYNSKISERTLGVQDSIMGGNHWGLSGQEDLGNGTSALFVLESGFNLSDGTHEDEDRLFGRQAIIGLAGDNWGAVTIGRQYNVGDDFIAPIDPFGTEGGLASATTIFGSALSESYDRAIKYVSPEFGGFQFGWGIVHADEERKTTAANGNRYKRTDHALGVTTGLAITSGPLYLGASFDYVEKRIKDNHSAAEVQDFNFKSRAWNIGATYDFDVVKLHLLYGGMSGGHINPDADLEAGIGTLTAAAVNSLNAIDEDLDTDAFGGKGLRQHSWLVGLSAPVGDEGELMFSYAGNAAKNTHWNSELKVKSHNFGLGYNYNLSKRTSVYGVASYGWAEAKNRPADAAARYKAKTTATQAVVGLQHRF